MIDQMFHVLKISLLRLWLGVFAGLIAVHPVAAKDAPVTVFAAASLKTALDEIAQEFEAKTGQSMVAAYAGTSVLARQIAQGAPADLFISANPDWMDYLEARALLKEGTRRALLSNGLVLIAPQDSALGDASFDETLDIASLLDGGRLAMGLVEAVPAGIYGKAALQSIGQWDQIASQVAQADNVRAALALVAMGEAPLGIVYATDALAEPRVRVIADVPQHSHPPITYPIALIKGRDTSAAQALMTYLASEDARAIFLRHGFAMAED